ncbi:ACT domain-containing protein ACR9 [Hibiscus syriacus]|uniref:ACT domain-containing protein ACR n=1 Tax=Hibiscus syriacus TaxID=106335 RepID=A0A6A3ADE5_HIBSY|nr:ACT domain-containing protein ACR9 [Hibiscus syriacus]
MGILSEDVVLIQLPKDPSDPTVVTFNCPDKPGLGCDLCRTLLEVGLSITRADFSTDGRWCCIVFWLVPNVPNSCKIDWESLKNRMKVMTTPDGRVIDLFFIADGMELLHTKKRREDTEEHLIAVLGNYCISFELQLAGPEYESLKALPSLSPAVEEELFTYELASKEASSKERKSDDTEEGQTSKDFYFQIAHGRFSSSVKGYRNLDLFIRQANGKKIVDPKRQNVLCPRLKEEMLHPFRVIIVNRGPDTELLVANPVESSGKGRPRVFYDFTLALKMLGMCIFSAEIGRHSASDRQWEVNRFLLDDSHEFPLTSNRARNQLVDRVRRILMGW